MADIRDLSIVLDRIDQAIIEVLRHEGRITYQKAFRARPSHAQAVPGTGAQTRTARGHSWVWRDSR